MNPHEWIISDERWAELEAEKVERMRKVYDRERALRAIALQEALAARAAGKRVPAGRRYRDGGAWRSLYAVFAKGRQPSWTTFVFTDAELGTIETTATIGEHTNGDGAVEAARPLADPSGKEST